MDIGPCDFVECVHEEPCDACGAASGLTVGSVYVVLEVGYWPISAFREAPGVILMKPPVPPGHAAFPLDWFRPIYRPKGDFLESLKIKELEPA